MQVTETIEMPVSERPAVGFRYIEGNAMETRTTKLETSLDHLQNDIAFIKGDVHDLRSSQRTDFRITWAGLIGVAAIMAKGFHWF